MCPLINVPLIIPYRALLFGINHLFEVLCVFNEKFIIIEKFVVLFQKMLKYLIFLIILLKFVYGQNFLKFHLKDSILTE